MQNNDGLLDEETVTGGATRNDSTIIQASRPPRSRVRRRVSRSPRSRVRRRVRTPSTITSVFRRTPSSIARAPVSTLNLTDLHQFRENLTTGYLGEALIQSFLDREVQANNDGLLDENTVTGGATRNDSTIIQASRPPGSRVRRTVPTPSTITSLFRRTPSSLARTLFSTHNLTDLYPLSRNLAAGHLGEALIQSFQEREVEVEIVETHTVTKSSTNNNNINNNYLLSPAPSKLLKHPSPFVPGFDEPLLPKKIRKKKKRIQLEDPPETERDMEWLCYTGSETDTEARDHDRNRLQYGLKSSQVDLQAGKNPPAERQATSAMSGSEMIMEHMSLFFTFLKCTGRMPFVMKTEGNLTQFTVNRKSLNYIAFCLTTIFMTLVTVIMLSSFVRIPFQSTTNFYVKIEHLEFDKYKEFALFTMLNLFYTVICSLNMIFDSCIAISHYFSKWNRTCKNLQYNTVFKIKYITIREAIFLAVYGGLLIIGMFLDTMFVDWNGAFGFISLLVVRDWILKFRFREEYVWLRWLGLFIHLYSLIASRLLTNLVILYSRALESMARSYNLRLSCAFGLVGKEVKEGKTVVLRRRMPLKNLFAEHLLITNFSREMGAVFSVLLTTFISTKIIAMIVSAYYLLLIREGEVSSDYSRHAVAANKSLIPMKDFLSFEAALFIISVIVGFSWFEFWYSLECVREAGEVIMVALTYVTRQGLVLCKTSMERRFILSMQGAFNSKQEYYICSINRPYIFGIIALIFSYSVSLDGFYRQRLPSQQIVACDSSGVCRKASYNPALPNFGQDIVIPTGWEVKKTKSAPVLKHDQKMEQSDDPTTGITAKKGYDFQKFLKNFLYECTDIHNSTKKITRLRLILWTDDVSNKNMYAFDSLVSEKEIGDSTVENCNEDGRPFPKSTHKEFTDDKAAMVAAGVDWSGNDWRHLCQRVTRAPHKPTDDCGNIPVRLPNKETGEVVHPDLVLTTITIGSKKLKYCCFQWEGYHTLCGLAAKSSNQTLKEIEKSVIARCATDLGGMKTRKGRHPCTKKTDAFKIPDVCSNFQKYE